MRRHRGLARAERGHARQARHHRVVAVGAARDIDAGRVAAQRPRVEERAVRRVELRILSVSRIVFPEIRPLGCHVSVTSISTLTAGFGEA